MSLNDCIIGSIARGYVQLDGYAQPRGQSYGGDQSHESNSRNRNIQGHYKLAGCSID